MPGIRSKSMLRRIVNIGLLCVEWTARPSMQSLAAAVGARAEPTSDTQMRRFGPELRISREWSSNRQSTQPKYPL